MKRAGTPHGAALGASRTVRFAAVALLAGFALAAHAQTTPTGLTPTGPTPTGPTPTGLTPAGLWKTIDDETHREKSLVRIVETHGVLSGTIEKLLDPAVPADAVCQKCPDERKDKPLVGLPLIRHLGDHAADTPVWSGGEILDPNNGKTYRLRVTLIDGGKRMEVRGYIGTPLLGRTQTWTRVE